MCRYDRPHIAGSSSPERSVHPGEEGPVSRKHLFHWWRVMFANGCPPKLSDIASYRPTKHNLTDVRR